MNDQTLWEKGLRSTKKTLAALPVNKKNCLSALLSRYYREKEALAAIALQADSATICRNCAGQCCLNGKYRMNVLDVLFHFTAGITIIPDFLQKPLCPYGTVHGCTMEPGFRPADCVFFICETLDKSLSDSDRSKLSSGENVIRECLFEASRLLGVPVATPLLLWAENRTP